MKRLTLTVLAAAAVVAAPVALAQKSHAPGGPGMGGAYGILRFDANGDGKLTRTELEAGQKSAFAELDANKDGKATRAEMQAAMQARREDAKDARFERLDANKDGQISKAELAAAKDASPPRMQGRPGPGRGPGAGMHGDRPDGDLTFEAFSTRGSAMFDRLDADKDGTVTVKEIQAAHGPA